MQKIVERTSLYNLRSKKKILRGAFLKSAPLFFLLVLGCVTEERPNFELALAREALNSATEVDSAKYSTANYTRAEEAYRKAMSLYKEGSYSEAVVEFQNARVYSEKAENAARIQRQKTGDEGL